MRQGQTHRIRVLTHMMPFLVVLQHELAVLLVDLRLTVHRLHQILILLMRVLGVTGTKQIKDMNHLLCIQHRRFGIECCYDRVVHLTEYLHMVLSRAQFGGM